MSPSPTSPRPVSVSCRVQSRSLFRWVSAASLVALMVTGEFGAGQSNADAMNDQPSAPGEAPDPNLRSPKKRPIEDARIPTNGHITISHARRAITSCHRVQEEGKARCEAAGYVEQSGQTDVAIVPFYLRGLWGSQLSRSSKGLMRRRTSGLKRHGRSWALESSSITTCLE